MPLTAIGGASGTVTIGNETTGFFPEVLHPDVQAYVGAQASVGYVMSVNEIDSVNNLVWAMIGSGLWDKMQVVYPCIGNSTTGANSFKWNLKNISTKNLVFTGAWTFASTGMQISTRSSAIFASTGYNAGIDGQFQNIHMGIYIRNFSTGSPNLGSAIAGYYRSSTSGGAGGVMITPGAALNTAYGWCQNLGTTSGILSTSGVVGGLLTVTRSASIPNGLHTLNGLQRVGAALGSGTAEPVGFNQIFTLGRATIVAATVTVDPQEFAFASIGRGFTRTDIQNYYSIVQGFQTKLGRQV
jgi:hypothetical protein